MQSRSWEMLGWMKYKLESRLPGEISITSVMQMTPPYGRKWRGTQKPLDESESGEWKSWLKAQHSEMKIMASGPITSWQIVGETVADFIFLGSKITADGDCSHEIKRCFLLRRKIMTNLDSIVGKGNGSPLQCSCLENPSNGGAWWAAVYVVAQSWTWLR